MAYNESLLQWVWQELQFNCNNLRTSCGKKIEIRDNGTLNHGAGPDFLSAHLFIDGLDWHGSVEVHNTAAEWFRHGHHRDDNFNNVILHVVGSENDLVSVKTSGGSEPFTLCLRPYLQKGLSNLLQESKGRSIPCAGNVEFIHQYAFEQQVEKAHKEYFDFKIDELLQLYPAGVPVIKAWRQAFIHQVYRTFGISANREQMSQLGQRVASSGCSGLDLQAWQYEVHRMAFEDGNPAARIDWKTTGIRPSGRPRCRVRQAAAFQHSAVSLNPRNFLEGPQIAWQKIQKVIPANSRPGNMMDRLIFYTAFLPALYLLGKLLHDMALMNNCYTQWRDQEAFVPAGIQLPFKRAGFEINTKVKKLGLAHQYKRYCTTRNCRDCKVFKNAIRA